ncbi:hypothetical protein HOF56_03360 [Candidatus Peribacteria bacterium]|nr:hypothetical protein [Candidatus Peribacteria bacterium]MBT4021054.1 hypothetical protein [Candidatus Peribacteria bacterium]MBT4240775.1 hypothetical protein [Candidatus Peribacteria bacterium]MBT4474196.1 hypothetical protein [Candidatus Peribacteria bacterium]
MPIHRILPESQEIPKRQFTKNGETTPARAMGRTERINPAYVDNLADVLDVSREQVVDAMGTPPEDSHMVPIFKKGTEPYVYSGCRKGSV